MSKRLGIGEFERTDVEIRQSTLEARHKFLKVLAEKKSDCLFNLLRLFNSDFVPNEFFDKELIDNTFYLFFQFLISKRPYDIPSNIIDTPLINYYLFLFDREDEIKGLENYEEFEPLTLQNPIVRRKRAIRKIVGTWNDLNSREEAKAFCLSLETWAKSYNLNEDWFLDFALKVLSGFKAEFDFEVSRFKRMSATPTMISRFTTAYRLKCRDSIRKGIYDYWHDEIWVNQLEGLDDLADIPSFNYRWRDFELTSDTWLVRMMSRKEFVALMNERLKQRKEEVWHLRTNFPQSTASELKDLFQQYRNYLENYCDGIEKQKAENIDESHFPPVDFGGEEKLVWIPSKQDRKQFVENTYRKFKTKIKKNNEEAKSLDTFTKRHFEAELTKYCNDIEKSLPKGWVKTPMKYSDDKHFEWLVDYQIEPGKSFTEIVKEEKIKDRKTVREAVQDLARIIGISLRQSKRTGKPRGTKNSPNSNKQLRIFQK